MLMIQVYFFSNESVFGHCLVYTHPPSDGVSRGDVFFLAFFVIANATQHWLVADWYFRFVLLSREPVVPRSGSRSC